MRTLPVHVTLAVLAAVVTCGLANAADHQLAHTVFFKLKADSADAGEQLVAGCQKFLSGHEGVVYFAVGVRAQELKRDVNVSDFDVSLYVVFKNKEAHDQYQTAPRHLKFVEEYSSLWDGVRVFDSYLALAPAAQQADRSGNRIPIPDPAALFAGMVRGKVLEKRKGGLVLMVEEVTRQWKTSKAKDAQALVGKRVSVLSSDSVPVARFVADLKQGESVELDVANRKGEDLIILELTAEQRERVK